MGQNKFLSRYLVLKLIRVYQQTFSPDHGWFSQATFHGCKYRPTCSEYTYEAIEIYGITKGMWMGTKRIFRCNPISKGGYDPVPTKQIEIKKK
ncbi:MAG: membrane protein insertion efficiency factor YidD [bacterium]|nr:membrane protein insertion efficiency factor YidD [bacterium]